MRNCFVGFYIEVKIRNLFRNFYFVFFLYKSQRSTFLLKVCYSNFLTFMGMMKKIVKLDDLASLYIRESISPSNNIMANDIELLFFDDIESNEIATSSR